MILRLLGPQGIAGVAVAAILAALLLLQKGETRHWRRQSGQLDQLYREEQAAFAGTVANYRAAADAARAADAAAASRVRAEQSAINQRTRDALEIRLADVRARAERLRLETASRAADRGGAGTAAVPGLPAAPGRAAETAGEDRLPDPDRLTATEQAIQLDELIGWVRAQASVSTER